MQYLVYFYKDKQLVVVDSDDVFLGDFEEFSLKDWQQHSDEECVVKVIYGDDCYEACVLQVSLLQHFLLEYFDPQASLTKLKQFQVIPDDEDLTAYLVKLRSYQERKRLKLSSLLKLVNRVKDKKRSKMPPVDVSQFLLKVADRFLYACYSLATSLIMMQHLTRYE